MSAAVLLSCHGTVSRHEDIPAFLHNIRRGRPTPPELVQEIAHRFDAIGGSPLMTITEAQARALEARLGVPVAVCARLWHPYPSEVLPALLAQGVRTVISLPLAPQSVDVYHAAIREAAAAHPDLTVRAAPAWGLEPALLDAFIETIDEALAAEPEADRNTIPIILSAHSLPRRVIAMGDRYEIEFRAMAGAVAERLEARGFQTHIAFQSQGASAEPWIGPDLPETFATLARAGAHTALIAPIGFLAEHVETLYDLDIEAPKLAAQAGLPRLLRARAVSTRPRFIDALEAVARRVL
ncbi:ferrochelatase [Chondromyces apiculatus]|uniref:Ferrochelatase n=1 Tax=Chondromyces apiculatus DSM 436 TaxID=1192034 RepID=A0A017THB8_9BACT|nr:ferrochelatase [Chondromyces apiculatus]EYF08663.1 Ferrochelatase, protoheme ferro-lyase [Chondromyces apiculatus DSM 436]